MENDPERPVLGKHGQTEAAGFIFEVFKGDAK